MSVIFFREIAILNGSNNTNDPSIFRKKLMPIFERKCMQEDAECRIFQTLVIERI